MAKVKKPKKKVAAATKAKKPAANAKKASAKKASTKAKARKPAASAKAKKPSAKPKKPARERGVTVADYAAKFKPWQQSVIGQLREILREGAPGATEEIKWGQPVYDWNGPFAHIKAYPSSVSFGFWRGANLTDPQGLLSGDGDRMKYVKITSAEAIEHKAFVALVREAVRLNDELGDPTRR